ncbi:MAG: hypothetical protein CL955_05460 [Erythrobacteraceae bacterium]|nr:hypothetical protein [Erythrobacteraceae bacterium]
MQGQRNGAFATRFAALATATAIGLVSPVAAEQAGQDGGAQSVSPEENASSSENPRDQIRREITEWTDRDMRADPDASVAAMRELKARAFAEPTASTEDRADATSLLGTALFAGQNYQESADEFAQAAQLWAQIPGREDKQAEVLNNRGVLLRALKRLPEAEASLQEALAIRLALYGPEHEDVASSTYSLANVFFSQGRFEDALPLMREAARQRELLTPDQPQIVVQAILGLGSVLDDSGRDTEALVEMRRAEKLARETLGTDHQSYGTVMHNIGLLLTDMGMHQQATAAIRQAVEVRRNTNGENSPWTASSVSSLATNLQSGGFTEEAMVLHAQALEVMLDNRDVVGPETIARVYAEMARAQASEGDWDSFYQFVERGIEEVDAGLDETHLMRSNLHLLKATGLEAQERFDEALVIAERWVPIQVETLIPSHRTRLASELLLARLRQATGAQEDDYWPAADSAIERLESSLTDLSRGESERVGEARANRQAAISYLQMALASADDEKAIRAAQLVNISNLSLGREASSAEAREMTEPERLHARLIETSRLETGLNQRRKVAIEAGADDRLTDLDAEIISLAAERALLAERLKRDHPDWLAHARPAPIALADLRAGLRGDESLILFVEGEPTSWALHVSPDGAVVSRSFSSREAFASVAKLRAAVDGETAQTFPLQESARLYDAIFGDMPTLPKAISVYGGVQLASLPLSILTAGEYVGPLADAPWLIRYSSIRTLGNLAMLDAANASRAELEGNSFAGIGGVVPQGGIASDQSVAALFRNGRPDPESVNALSYLPNAILELEQIANALNSEDRLMLVGAGVSETAFKTADLSDRNLIAFATHGLTAGRVDGVWEPSLLLGQPSDDPSEDGLLGASEIARLELSADWIILSACDTATGASADAPPFSGLATAFSQAGAKSLLLAHWPVRDDAVAFVTTGTVRHAAQGLDRAEALRRAQLELMRSPALPDSASPAIWAPLILIE